MENTLAPPAVPPVLLELATPAFAYSPTLFSKKLLFPLREISSIQAKGLVTL